MKTINVYINRLIFLAIIMTGLLLHVSQAGAQELKLNVKEHVLKNGLTLLMLENRRSPTVSLRIVFKVGSVNERIGITGASHLFEHMMFKGTQLFGTKDWETEEPLLEKEDELVTAIVATDDQQVRKALEEELTDVRKQLKAITATEEFWSIYMRSGATGINASTSDDITRYYCNLPANKLKLWAFIESDRMKNLVLREFYSEKDVVMEERRMRTDTSPFGLMFEQLNAAAFTAHPYGWPVIGWMSDIDNITKEQTEDYFTRYYSPNNAVIVAVGDINPQEVIDLVEEYFGDIPAQPPIPEVTTVEPEQKGERRVEVEYDANPMVAIAYHKPEITHPDQYVFEVIQSLLSNGRTSRLYKKLIEEDRVAVMARSYSGGSKYPDLFFAFASPRHPHTTEEVEKAIYEQLERLKTEPPSEWELQKIKNQLEANFIRGLVSNSGLADEIGYYEAVADDWRYVNTAIERIKAVTGKDVMRVASKYFVKTNRTVGTLVQKKEGT
jgi:predicted Zn-dependent peptidase